MDFFSSRNSVKHFFAQNPELPPHVKYGVVSLGSANELLLYDKKADFVGEGTDLVKIAKRFREVLQDESVLFPQAMDSLQSIQKQLAFTNTTYTYIPIKPFLKLILNCLIQILLFLQALQMLKLISQNINLIPGS